MADTHYLISDASRKVDVESHVLRYWEEELEMNIPRNEMGHRYYTELHIRLFKRRLPDPWNQMGKWLFPMIFWRRMLWLL